MWITDVRIEQELYDIKTKETFTVQAVFSDGRIQDTNLNMHSALNVEPYKHKPYIETDYSGYTNLCIKTPVGTLQASMYGDKDREARGLDICLMDEDIDDCISLASIVIEPDKTIISAFDDITTTNPTHEFSIQNKDIDDYFKERRELQLDEGCY